MFRSRRRPRSTCARIRRRAMKIMRTVLFFFAALCSIAAAPSAFEGSRTIYDPSRAMTPLETTSSETLRALGHAVHRTPRLNFWEQRSNAAGYLNPVIGDRFVPDRGQRLVDVLANLPAERRALG